jgi:hypothetical protein
MSGAPFAEPSPGLTGLGAGSAAGFAAGALDAAGEGAGLALEGAGAVER